MAKSFDIVVIGGGAAGMMASIAAAKRGASVLLLERMEKCGRKIRITGKGRCNLTNMGDDYAEKIYSGGEFMSSALDVLSPQALVEMFEKMGVKTISERGNRLFPASGKAWDVADGMVRYATRVGVTIRYRARVQDIITKDGTAVGVALEGGEKIFASSIILATGGKSYPRTGSSGDGYFMAHDLGHRIEPLRPSLVSLGIDSHELGRLSGLKLKNISLALLVDGEVADSRFGELEFYDYGIGGAITLQVSRGAVDGLIDGKRVEVEIDLKPALSREKLLGRMERECDGGVRDCGSLLRKLVPQALMGDILLKAKLKSSAVCQPTNRERLADTLKALRYGVTDYGSFDEAVVTAGGVDLADINPETMASRKIEGLYFAGELIDIDAQTGGYNLQLAFSTGYLAGISACSTKHQQDDRLTTP